MTSELKKDILAAIFEGVPFDDEPQSWKGADIPGRERIKLAYKLLKTSGLNRKTVKKVLEESGY